MNLRRILNLGFVVLIAIGLTTAPLAQPAAARSMAMSGMADMPGMSKDVPCCPGEQNKDCQDCPLVAMCGLKTMPAGPSAAAAVPLRHAIRTVHSFSDDAHADGLDRQPPDHPPRA